MEQVQKFHLRKKKILRIITIKWKHGSHLGQHLKYPRNNYILDYILHILLNNIIHTYLFKKDDEHLDYCKWLQLFHISMCVCVCKISTMSEIWQTV